jgi:beta-galactosidase
MKRKLINSLGLFILFLSFSLTCLTCAQDNRAQRTSSFDENWRFLRENPAGAENPSFNDSKWRIVDLPHDWSIEDLPNQTGDSISGPFSKASIGKMATGFTVGGTAWYRKNFTINNADKDKTVYLQFDGVYMNSDIWINGKHAGNHPYGYTSFYFDITPYLSPAGEPNIVAVQVKNEGKNSRWYSGSGIYRHTWLTLVNPIHIATWGIYVTTPVVTEKSAEVAINTTLANKSKENAPVTLILEIYDPSGKIVGRKEVNSSINSGSKADIKQIIPVENPALWSTENPNLYQVRVTVLVNKNKVDDLQTSFGIRSLRFDSKTGFTLNSKNMKLKGGCFHHDNGPLGSAAIDRAEERKIELLKKAGFNAIRCSHNPPSPYLLDACDRLGMLVIDEFADMWEKPKASPDDYSKYFKSNWKQDVTSIILRDRNHPSVMLWSIGNEIPEAADTSGLRIAKNLADEVRKIDPSRGVTEAMVDLAGILTGKSGWEKQGPHMKLLDVVGYNYGYSFYEQDHLKFPERIIIGTETMPPLSLENWQMVEKLPYVIGNFTWTAMDYLGEAGTGLPRLIDTESKTTKPGSDQMAMFMIFFNPDSWPVFNDYQGDIDLIGNRKTPSYYQHVVWRVSKIEMLVHKPIPAGKKEIVSPWGFPDELKSWNWTGHEGEKMQVQVYTRCQLVKLELNGKVIGEQAIDDNKSITATFEVPYEAGTLTARCYENGKETASQTLKTVGKPASVRLVADRQTIKASRNDLSYVMVDITDADANVIPYADDMIVKFEINGSGTIAGVGNGNPADMSSFQQPAKKTFQGKCLAIVRSTGKAGKIVLKASAEGLPEASVEIMAKDK